MPQRTAIVHIHTFRKRWIFIWGWFFLVIILKCSNRQHPWEINYVSKVCPISLEKCFLEILNYLLVAFMTINTWATHLVWCISWGNNIPATSIIWITAWDNERCHFFLVCFTIWKEQSEFSSKSTYV